MKKALLLALAFILPSLVIGQTILVQKGMTDARILLNLGDYLLKNGFEDAAQSAYEKALQLDHKDTVVLNGIGYFYREKNPNLAEEYFLKALETDPLDEVTRINLALLYGNMSNYGSAIKHLAFLVENHPENTTYMYELANNLASRYYYVTKEYSDLKSALDNFKKAKDMDSDYPHVKEKIKALTEVMKMIEA